MTAVSEAPAPEAVRPPARGSAELAAVIAEIADDAARRRAGGGTEGPRRAVELIREHRLGAVRVPLEHGGGGYTLQNLFDLVIDLAEADPDVPHIIRVHYAFVEELLRVPRTERKDAWLPEVLSGKLFGGASSELSTRAVGSYSFESTLTPQSGGYRLDGVKFYSTGSLYSDFIRVSANLPDGKALSAIVPADRAGIVHEDDWDGIGQRHTGSGTTVFENVAVAESETLPFRGGDEETRPRQALPQLYLHAIAAGILRAVTTEAAALVRGRKRSFVFAVAEEPRHDPQLLEVIGTLSAAAFAAESVVRAAAAAQDVAADVARTSGVDARLEQDAAVLAAKVKVSIEDVALRAATRLFEVGGASATRESAHLDRHWRNLRTLFSHNPTVYKARVIGDLVVNETPLPDTGFF
ncbi:acyl-CoA dehydrogenase family protein [Rhodococcus sp. T7]|uniref:acyl-CoA dehydrogenase family protein n=1 Tax=Rhodococcus sp. T7 TaxID=627444 RepID=UPI001357222D|nr:acyl-CoA dehydrogenase family protein [Rhodococcus sp. T7]KAF0959687.1 Dibenzothiophene desulfurization enzyme C [Rhodococcus sp. T7]